MVLEMLKARRKVSALKLSEQRHKHDNEFLNHIVTGATFAKEAEKV
jgi:hypothetical protein